jgi:tetratricopeptide (TPR) repeat protein
MQNWRPTNPVDRRLMNAHSDWMKFSQNKPARLLYWQTNQADQELIKIYFQAQQALSCAVFCPDFDFVNGEKYASTLSSEIMGFYEKSRSGSARNGINADWLAPKKNILETQTQYLLKTANSLMQHHPDVFPGMVLVFHPPSLKNPRDFEHWLDTLLQNNRMPPWQSDRIRFVLYGTDEKPLPRLRQKYPQIVQVVTGKYHMETVPRELIAASGERGASGRFRRLFVELGETLSHDDPARLETLREAALQISTQEKWHDQSVMIHLLAGAAYMKWKTHKNALDAYQQAEHCARQALQAEHPAGNKLMLNALFGQASVWMAQKKYDDAARCYVQTAPYAEADRDGLLAVEAWRMAAFCLEKTRLSTKQAIEAGFKALQAGQWIDPPLRANSNLPLVVDWMLKRVGIFGKQRNQLDDLLTALYGPDWRKARQPKTPEEVSRQLTAHQSQNQVDPQPE